jgi:chromosome segregation ATPase
MQIPDGTGGPDPLKKTKSKTTFPKERLYQLQKQYRERKKEKVKKLEMDLDEARAKIEAEKAATDAAHAEIIQLKLQAASFRMKYEVATNELEETKFAMNLLRRGNSLSRCKTT